MSKSSFAVRSALFVLAGSWLLAMPSRAAGAPLSSSPRDFHQLAAGTVFIADTRGPHGSLPLHTSLWRTDGTAAGTFELRLCSAACDPRARIVAVGEGQAFVTAFDDDLGWAMWRTDGSQEGTRRLTPAELVGDPSEPYTVTWAADLGLFVFPAEEADGWSLWGSDGTAAGTRRLVTLPPEVTATPFGAVEHDGAVYFFVSPFEPSVSTFELWRTAGTPETTAPVTTLEARMIRHDVGPAVSLPGGLIFVARDLILDHPLLWRTDGTAAGTALLAAFTGSFVRHVGRVGERGLFWGVDATGFQLWASDGSDAGTERLTDVADSTSLYLGAWAPFPWQGGLLFNGWRRDDVNEIWFSDGTKEGTRRLLEVVDGELVGVNEHRFYFATRTPQPDGPLQVWESDGTPGGTRVAAAVDLARIAGTRPPPLLQVGDSMFFVASEPGGLDGLWALPVAGGPPRQLNALGEGFRRPFGPRWEAVAVGDRLVFAADDGQHGLELWISDGTAAGSRLLADLAPGVDGFPSCVPTDTTLCLAGGRFEVEVAWRDQHNGGEGVGRTFPSAGSDVSGYFWFFTPDNVELIVKVLDGTSINGFHWTFYGALTDVEFDLTVTDTVTGEHRTYHNPPGEICGHGDTASLPEAGAAAEAATAARSRAAKAAGLRALALPGDGRKVLRDGVVAAAHPAETCFPDDRTLCLLDGRFRVTVDWQDQHNGGEGPGGALPFTDLTGFFWFFTPDNVELVVKALDATALNGHYWFFYGALSDVGYTITVEDLVDGHRSRQYVNPAGEICGRGDTTAFEG